MLFRSIMIENVAGGMADIAASQGADIEHADLALGEDIAARYDALWHELTDETIITSEERYRITERVRRLNELGFEVEDLELIPTDDGSRLRMSLTVGGRQFHARRLRDLTGVDASEEQARQILTDLTRYEAAHAADTSTPTGKALGAMRWRVEVFEPIIERARRLAIRHADDPLQAFTDFLHHRYAISSDRGRDVPNDEAFEHWVESGQPGYPFV